MLHREVAGIDEPGKRLATAHAFLDAYLATPDEDDRPAQAALRSEAKLMRKKPGAVLFHDELGDCFNPQALYDVAMAAERHGLQFLGDAGEGPLGDGFLPDDVEDTSTQAVVRAAQRQDDRNVRFFRQSLFVRAGQTPVRHVDPALIGPLFVSSNAQRPADAPFKNWAELVTYAKKNPGKLSAGGPAPGGMMNLIVLETAKRAGIDVTYVPFTGGGPSGTALLGGPVEYRVAQPSEVSPNA